MTRLEGRHALVTGGSRGIGRAIAGALTQAGAHVTITGRSRNALQEAVAAGAAAEVIVADATDEKAMVEGVRRIAQQHGAIDILIANAGGAESLPFQKADAGHFRRMIDLNLMSTVHAIHAVLDGMIAGKFGRIVAIASTSGLKGYPYVSAYAAAKHAVVGLVRSLALETARHGVTVNAVCPSFTDTEMIHADMRRAAEKSGRAPEDILASMVKGLPIGRLVQPSEVAASVAFLCSADAAAITGTTLAVTGGEL
ncbi:MAG TPA: SDR family NAD(P)-dependent oxidoreductase [Pseudolabrys sp.]|nr:SDR family NAD(P)-dependent oxidoreductase [Pseudolabrys sp.]